MIRCNRHRRFHPEGQHLFRKQNAGMTARHKYADGAQNKPGTSADRRAFTPSRSSAHCGAQSGGTRNNARILAYRTRASSANE